MEKFVSTERLRLVVNRFRERLWVKPLGMCLLSIAAAFGAKLADGTGLGRFTPPVAIESVETLLSIMASSMLVIATFAVASMVSAYASASSTATPRSFTLVVADDVSQNALSTFIGAFIFSIVALTAVKNEYFQRAGLFVLFVLTVFAFAMVIITFVRWVDRIARLGRLGSTIEKVEKATAGALKRQRDAPTLYGMPLESRAGGRAVFASRVGYVQCIEMAKLQAWAEQAQAHVVVVALPGSFAAPGNALAYVHGAQAAQAAVDCEPVAAAFQIGRGRRFDDDPRFGLVVLSEIAGRALSPAVNDPGTAIDVIGSMVRLLAACTDPATPAEQGAPTYDRVQVPELSMQDLFDDAFTAIARDGAGTVEVAVRLQEALHSLAATGMAPMRDAATHHSLQALERAQQAMPLAADLDAVRLAAASMPARPCQP